MLIFDQRFSSVNVSFLSISNLSSMLELFFQNTNHNITLLYLKVFKSLSCNKLQTGMHSLKSRLTTQQVVTCIYHLYISLEQFLLLEFSKILHILTLPVPFPMLFLLLRRSTLFSFISKNQMLLPFRRALGPIQTPSFAPITPATSWEQTMWTLSEQ